MPDKPKPHGYKERRKLSLIAELEEQVQDLLDEIVTGDRKRWSHNQIKQFWEVSRLVREMGDLAADVMLIRDDYEEEKKILEYKRRNIGSDDGR